MKSRQLREMEEVIFYELLGWTELWCDNTPQGKWKNTGGGSTRNCTRYRAACQQNRDFQGKSGEEQARGVPSHFSPPFPGIEETEIQSPREINCDEVTSEWQAQQKGLSVSFLLKLVFWNLILNIMNGISRWGPREMVGSWDKTHNDGISVPLIKRPQRAIVWLQC